MIQFVMQNKRAFLGLLFAGSALAQGPLFHITPEIDYMDFPPGRALVLDEGLVYIYFNMGNVYGGSFAGSPVGLNPETGALVEGAVLETLGGALALTQLSDGRLIVAYSTGWGHMEIRRTLADGTKDESFAPFYVQNTVRWVKEQPDGKLLLVAEIGSIDPASSIPGYAIGAVIRLLADGRVDPDFTQYPLNGVAFTPPYIDESGNIYLGGSLGHFSEVGRNLVRLKPDGSKDAAYQGLKAIPEDFTNTMVRGIGQQSDGRLLIAGDFRIPASGNETYPVIRFNTDGSFDETFNLTSNATLGITRRARHMEILEDDRIVIISHKLMRLMADGTVDSGFESPAYLISPEVDAPTGEAFWFGRHPDGGYIVPRVGAVEGTARNGVVRFNADGSVNESFVLEKVGTITPITAMHAVGDAILVSGNFNTVGHADRDGIALLDRGGQLLADAYPIEPKAIHSLHNSLSAQSAEGLLHYRRFMNAEFATEAQLMLYAGAEAGIELPVDAMGLEPTSLHAANAGGYYIAGHPLPQTAVEGVATPLRRLNASGEIADSFALSAAFNWANTPDLRTDALTGSVKVLHEYSDGKLLLAYAEADGDAGITRVNADGTLDAAFAPEAAKHSAEQNITFSRNIIIDGIEDQVEWKRHSSLIKGAVVLPGGRMFIYGAFEALGGVALPGAAFLSADGQLESVAMSLGALSPHSPIPASIEAAHYGPDGWIYLAGYFSSINGVENTGLLRIAPTGEVDTDWTPTLGVTEDLRSDISHLFMGRELYVGGIFAGEGTTQPRSIERYRLPGYVWHDPRLEIGGWRYWDWLGWFTSRSNGLVMLANGTWLYLLSPTSDNVYFYDYTEGAWSWMTQDWFPWVYRYGANPYWEKADWLAN